MNKKYIKYHVGSGFIVSTLNVSSSSQLTVHAQSGFDFLELDVPDQSEVYVSNGILANRQMVTIPETIAAAVSETVSITVPVGTWYRLDFGVPVQSTAGTINLNRTVDTSLTLELVGRYSANNGGRNTWSTITWTGLANIRSDIKTKIDQDAEAARARAITPGSGQAMTYLRKAEAARMFLANDPNLDGALLQRITDEATRLGVTNQVAAETLLAIAGQWEMLDALIDNIRLTAKDQVDAALDGEAISEVYSSIVWPL